MIKRTMPKIASEWLVALNEAPGDAALRREHRRWLADNDGNRRDWDETLQAWRLMAMTLPAHGDEWSGSAVTTAASIRTAGKRHARQGNRSASAKRRPRDRLRRSFFAMGGLAVAAALAFALLPDALLTLRADHSSATGEVVIVDLEDGSSLQLAPESAVTLAFDSSLRRVELLRGDAFFDVSAEQDRPFQVRAGAVDTVVLGTRFAVSLNRSGTQIAVEEGSVRVEHSHHQVGSSISSSRLSPGDVLKVGPDGDLTERSISPSLVAPWRNERLVAQDQPLNELVDVLDRYFAGTIIIADRKLARAPLTGIYNLSDPKAALLAMAQAQGAQVRQVSPWILVLSSR